eukprot:gene8685-biopygen14799
MYVGNVAGKQTSQPRTLFTARFKDAKNSILGQNPIIFRPMVKKVWGCDGWSANLPKDIQMVMVRLQHAS